MIKAIFFDFEGVITKNGRLLHENYYEKIKELISYDEFNVRYGKARLGEISYEEFVKGWPRPENVIMDKVIFGKNSKEILEYLYKKVPLFLASNHIPVLPKLEIKKLGAEKYFKKIFFSNEIKLKKPDDAFFKKIIQESGIKLKKNEMIFVDDAKANLETAKANGFFTVWVNQSNPKDHRNNVDYTPDYEITDLMEVAKICEKLN